MSRRNRLVKISNRHITWLNNVGLSAHCSKCGKVLVPSEYAYFPFGTFRVIPTYAVFGRKYKKHNGILCDNCYTSRYR
jgi:hypothetical protein